MSSGPLGGAGWYIAIRSLNACLSAWYAVGGSLVMAVRESSAAPAANTVGGTAIRCPATAMASAVPLSGWMRPKKSRWSPG